MRNTLGGSVRRPAATVAVLSLLALAASGCAAGGGYSAGRPLRAASQGPRLVFENAGVEPVKLYLSERGNEWFVGYVLPGRTEALPLPGALRAISVGRQLTLVVVPSTAARSGRPTTGAIPGVITSDSFSTDYLTSMRWKVVGRWLVPVPDPISP
jgi:hypothetical protein